MTSVVVWRHGRTAWNAESRFQGQLDVPMDGEGRAQVARAAPVLAGLGPALVVSSDAGRALDTAAALADLVGLPVVADPRLREIDFGTWSGLTHADVAEQFPQEYADWRAGVDARRGGGETFAEAGERSLAAVLEYAAKTDGLVVVVTHGGTARSLVTGLLGLPWETRRVFTPLGNARWAHLTTASRAGASGGGWSLAAYNAGAEPLPAPPPLTTTVDARG